MADNHRFPRKPPEEVLRKRGVTRMSLGQRPRDSVHTVLSPEEAPDLASMEQSHIPDTVEKAVDKPNLGENDLGLSLHKSVLDALEGGDLTDSCSVGAPSPQGVIVLISHPKLAAKVARVMQRVGLSTKVNRSATALYVHDPKQPLPKRAISAGRVASLYRKAFALYHDTPLTPGQAAQKVVGKAPAPVVKAFVRSIAAHRSWEALGPERQADLVNMFEHYIQRARKANTPTGPVTVQVQPPDPNKQFQDQLSQSGGKVQTPTTSTPPKPVTVEFENMDSAQKGMSQLSQPTARAASRRLGQRWAKQAWFQGVSVVTEMGYPEIQVKVDPRRLAGKERFPRQVDGFPVCVLLTAAAPHLKNVKWVTELAD